MLYYKDGQEFTEREIRLANSSSSFSSPLQLGYKLIQYEKPEPNELQVLVQVPSEETETHYIKKWEVRDKYTSDEKEEIEILTRNKERASKARREFALLIKKTLEDSSRSRGYESLTDELLFAASPCKFGDEARVTLKWLSALREIQLVLAEQLNSYSDILGYTKLLPKRREFEDAIS